MKHFATVLVILAILLVSGISLIIYVANQLSFDKTPAATFINYTLPDILKLWGSFLGNTATEHSCPDFDYQTKTATLPDAVANQLQNSLSECLPYVQSAVSPFVLCVTFTRDGAIGQISVSPTDIRHAKNDAAAPAVIEQAINDVKRNCGPFTFLPKEYYDSWKELELTIAPVK